MGIRQLFVGSLAALAMVGAVSVQAQGVFDLGALTNTLTIGTPTAAPSPTAAAATLDTLAYQRSPQRSAENVKKFITGLKQFNNDVGTQMEAGLANVDLIAALEQKLSPYGVNTNNMGDVLAVYWLAGWMGVNGHEAEPTQAQIAGMKQMVAATLGSAPQIKSLSDADKQDAAEGLLLQMFFNDMVLEGVKSQPEAVQRARAEVKNALKTASGLDTDQFTLSANGLVRKK